MIRPKQQNKIVDKFHNNTFFNLPLIRYKLLTIVVLVIVILLMQQVIVKGNRLTIPLIHKPTITPTNIPSNTPSPSPTITWGEEAIKILTENKNNKCPDVNTIYQWMKSLIDKNFISSREEMEKLKNDNKFYWACFLAFEETYKSQAYQKSTLPSNDSNPLVNCQVHANCGGGNTLLMQSECNNSTCCQINGKWVFYKDKDQCLKDQGNNNDTINNNYQLSQSQNGQANPSYNFPNYDLIKPTITCIVSYPCTGKNETYYTDQYTCDFMQSGAASTCSLYDSIKKMKEISNFDLPTIAVPKVDYSPHTDPTPTCRMTPYGCFSN